MKTVPLFLCLVLFVTLACGCSSLTGRAKSPAATMTAPNGGTLTQTGDAAKPAAASSSSGRSAFTVPKGVPVTIAPDGAASFTTTEPLTFSASFEAYRATGPQAFTPPAPPTPTDEAAGRASLWFRLGVAAGAALGIFGLIEGWKILALGGAALSGACLVALSLAAVPVWVWITLGIGAAAVIGGPALWHLKLAPLEAKAKAIEEKALAFLPKPAAGQAPAPASA